MAKVTNDECILHGEELKSLTECVIRIETNQKRAWEDYKQDKEDQDKIVKTINDLTSRIIVIETQRNAILGLGTVFGGVMGGLLSWIFNKI